MCCLKCSFVCSSPFLIVSVYSFRYISFIDRGEFGEVYQGTAIDILAVDSGPTPVAVKTMRKGASHDEKDKFLSEAALMR